MLARGGQVPQLPSLRDVPRPIRAVAAPLVALVSIAAAAWCLSGRAPGQGPAEHLSAASALAGGQMLYRDLFCDQAPGVYLVHRLIILAFGASASSLWFVDGASVTLSSLLIYLITRRFCQSTLAAILAGIAYPLLYYGAARDIPAQPAGWACVLFLAALYLLSAEGRIADWARTLPAGAAAGAAVLISPGVLIPSVLLIVIVRRLASGRRAGPALAWLALGAILPVLATLVWLGLAHALRDMREQLGVWGIQAWRSRFLLATGQQRPELADAVFARWLWERLALTLPGVIPFLAGLGAFVWRRHGEASGLLGLWLILSVLELALRPGLPNSAWAPVLAVWSITGAAGLEMMLRRSRTAFWRLLARSLIVCGLVISVAHVRNAARLSSADRTVSGPLATLAAQVRAMTGARDGVFVWDRAPHLYYLVNRPVSGGVISLDYFSSAFAASDDCRFFRARFEERPPALILMRRRRVGEGTQRLDGLWPEIPPRLGLIEAEVAGQYVLSGKIAGYEVFVRSVTSPAR